MIIMPLSILAIEDDSDRAFMEQLYLDHHAAMKRTARRILHHPEDAEDFVQSVCIALCKKVSLLREMECNSLRSSKIFSPSIIENEGYCPFMLNSVDLYLMKRIYEI